MKATKKCTCCGIVKGSTEFSRSQRDGQNSWCKPCAAKSARRWRSKNPEKHKAYMRAYKAANLEKVRECNRLACRRWREKNKEHVSRYTKKWREENKERAVLSSRIWEKKNKEYRAEYKRAHFYTHTYGAVLGPAIRKLNSALKAKGTK